MWIAWLIGVFLNVIVLLIWNLCRVSNNHHNFHRVPVNIIVAILYIILTFTPVFNWVLIFNWAITGFRTDQFNYQKDVFPKIVKWFNKPIFK